MSYKLQELSKVELHRLLSKVAIAESGCWEWLGAKRGGYGLVRIRKKQFGTHRLFYSFFKTIPQGLVIDHLCRNRKCVNPGHLEAVTFEENIKRGFNSFKTHCVNGHELSGANLEWQNNGKHRKCRTCNLASKRRYNTRRYNELKNNKPR